MGTVKKRTAFVYHPWFVRFITLLIVINFLILVQSTRGSDTTIIENIILLFFMIEVGMKIGHEGWKKFWKDGWNGFDFVIVAIGIIPLLGIPLPSGMSGLRALRLLRLVRVVPSLRQIIDAIGKSMKKMGGVAGLTVFFLAISALMATMSFQHDLPELFGSIEASLAVLLQLATFDSVGNVVSQAWAVNKVGTLLVFPLFFASVPLLTLNMVIGILGNALAEEGESPVYDEVVALRTELAEMRSETSALRDMVKMLIEKTDK